MAMVCPQCNKCFEQALMCVDCGARLQFHAQALAANPSPEDDSESQWQQTPWGRMLVGLLLAQGLGYGIQHLLMAGLTASGEEVNVWGTLWGIVALHGIQGLSLLVGGAICGAGRMRGVLYGSVVGLANGLIFLLVQRHSGEALTDMLVYGQPVLHMGFGALGGLIGTCIWKPIPQVVLPDMNPAANGPRLPTFQMLTGPVHLGRVLMGMSLVVMGVVWSHAILQLVLEASNGSLNIQSHLQATLIGFEISALTILFGSGFAGACTFNGMKQGLCVGLGAGLIFIAYQLGNSKAVLEKTMFMTICILVLSVVGGWFGGQLFPPVMAAKPRSRILA